MANTPKRPKINLVQTFIGVVLGAAIFALGVGVGNGKITFGPDAIFHKSSNQKLPDDLDYSSVERVYDTLKRSYDGDLKADDLLDGVKEGLAKATGDPYTEYMTPKEAKDFNEGLTGTFSGIGAELGKQDNSIVIIAPIAGYPAEKAGLKPKDVVAEIDGQSAFDITISEAVNRIRGPEGTKVKLKVVRDGKQELDFEITRQQITIPSVESQILDGNIGYLKISRFSDDTARLSRDAATKFQQAGVKGVIVDLRSNPGGLLDAAVDLSSIWLPSGKTVLQEKRGGVVVKTFQAKGNTILQGVPTVVLINEGSASASEITAGALKDNGVATLIGVKSFGKGSVQELDNLPGGAVLKVTIARWFTPGGKNIDKEGIEPDKKVERSEDDFKNNRDPQKQAAIDFINKK
jgi:carboxyl-terminal processing protease